MNPSWMPQGPAMARPNGYPQPAPLGAPATPNVDDLRKQALLQAMQKQGPVSSGGMNYNYGTTDKDVYRPSNQVFNPQGSFDFSNPNYGQMALNQLGKQGVVNEDRGLNVIGADKTLGNVNSSLDMSGVLSLLQDQMSENNDLRRKAMMDIMHKDVNTRNMISPRIVEGANGMRLATDMERYAVQRDKANLDLQQKQMQLPALNANATSSDGTTSSGSKGSKSAGGAGVGDFMDLIRNGPVTPEEINLKRLKALQEGEDIKNPIGGAVRQNIVAGLQQGLTPADTRERVEDQNKLFSAQVQQAYLGLDEKQKDIALKGLDVDKKTFENHLFTTDPKNADDYREKMAGMDQQKYVNDLRKSAAQADILETTSKMMQPAQGQSGMPTASDALAKSNGIVDVYGPDGKRVTGESAQSMPQPQASPMPIQSPSPTPPMSNPTQAPSPAVTPPVAPSRAQPSSAPAQMDSTPVQPDPSLFKRFASRNSGGSLYAGEQAGPSDSAMSTPPSMPRSQPEVSIGADGNVSVKVPSQQAAQDPEAINGRFLGYYASHPDIASSLPDGTVESIRGQSAMIHTYIDNVNKLEDLVREQGPTVQGKWGHGELLKQQQTILNMMSRSPDVFNLGTSFRETSLKQMNDITTGTIGILPKIKGTEQIIGALDNLKSFAQSKQDESLAQYGYSPRMVKIVGKSGNVYTVHESEKDQAINYLRNVKKDLD